MKNLVYVLASFFLVCITASCGMNGNKAENNSKQDTLANDSVVVDTISIDSVACDTIK